MSDLNLYSVNWQDGMLLSQQHLKEQERFFEELIRWYALRTGDFYGLVRKGYDAPPALNMSFSVRGERLRVEVVRCQAITPDGHFIEINESQGEPLGVDTALAAAELPVFVSVNPVEKSPTGEPDPEEAVPRLPYRTAGYTLHLGERPNWPHGQVVQVALLKVDGAEVTHSPDYLPPCVTLYSDERLHQRAVELRNRLETTLANGNRAFSTIAGSEAKSKIQQALRATVYRFVLHLSSALDEFVTGRNAGHPMTMILFSKKLFRVFRSLFDLHPAVKDYAHEKYFAREAGYDVSRFLSSIDEFLLSEYNHEDIGGQVRTIEGILDQIKGLLGYLAHVKGDELSPHAIAAETLTYAGRTYKILDYASSKMEQVGELTYLQVQIAAPRPLNDTVVLLWKGLLAKEDWSSMQVRLGVNDARGLGETDPVEIDAVSYGDKVAFHPYDMLKSQSVRQMTMIFRGVKDQQTFSRLGKTDLLIYAL